MGIIKKRVAVFFDRDGVLNKPLVIKNKPYPPKYVKDVVLYAGLVNGIKKLKKKKLKVLVITNQPDFERGKTTKKNITSINNFIKKKLRVHKIFTCYDSKSSSFFKKPNPGMIIQAKKEFNLDLKKSFIIGDTDKDIFAGKKMGLTTILVKKKYNFKYKKASNYSVNSTLDAIKKVLKIIDVK